MSKMKNKQPVKCREYFDCQKNDCPAFLAVDDKCWLKSGTFCHDKISGAWIEKMEACMACEVFKNNLDSESWPETLGLISSQFREIRGKLEKEQTELKTAEKKLNEFKITSVYLLKELDKKSREVTAERNNLEKNVKERTAELQEVQERLNQASRVAALSRFSSGIAHEINNPLGAIVNYVRTVLANPEIAGDNRNYLELSLKGLFRIENIIKQILLYSGRRVLEPTDIGRVVKDILEFTQHKIQEEKVKIKNEIEGELPQVYTDPSQLQQVFANIIKNGVEAMSDCETKQLTIRSFEKDNKISISFSDTGKGINQKDKDNMFTPFYTTKEVGSGIGLGLFISYNIVQISQGTLEIDNNKNGVGAVVTVTLPVLRKNENAKN